MRAVAARSAVVRTFARHLAEVQQRVAELERAIADALREDEDGRRLQDIPGVGPLHAATIRAELGDVRRFASVDEVIAYAVLEPRTRQSGALYLATLVAVRYRSEWKERYQRLLDRGRVRKGALTILSRGLLKVIFHLLRTGATYDPAVLKPRVDAGLDSRI